MDFPKKFLQTTVENLSTKRWKPFCKEKEIKMALGSPRTPTTQGLVERSNRSWKEDMRALILSTSSQNLKKWRQKAQEPAYTGNISYHRAINMTPYEAVYGIKSHREVYTSQHSEANQEDPDLRVDDNLKEREDEEGRPKKRQKISQNQEKYNHQIIEQTNKKKMKLEIRNSKLETLSQLKLIVLTKHHPFIQNSFWEKLKKV